MLPRSKKRAANDSGAGPTTTVKRPRPAPKAQLRPAAGLQPAGLTPASTQSNEQHQVIYISSTSPVPLLPPPPDQYRESTVEINNRPSGGIHPTDDFQDVIINSVEFAPPRNRNKRVGLDHYHYLDQKHPAKHANITYTFDTYRATAPLNAPPGEPLPDVIPQVLNLGPGVPGMFYHRYPAHRTEYYEPIYKGKTYNPLICLAILRIAQKNLPFMSFESDIAHLPNVGPQTLPPRFPPYTPDGDMPVLDLVTDWRIEEDDQVITVLFLPKYYNDGRHALGFYTRKSSGRLCSIVFTPCTTQELCFMGLLDPVDPGLSITDFSGSGIGGEGEIQWHDLEVGVKNGEWFHPGLPEDRVVWEALDDIVGCEWVIRVRITVRKIDEACAEARMRDSGRWRNTNFD